MNFRLGSLLLASVCCLSAFGQQAGTIKQILVKGNERVSSAAILAAMNSKAGAPCAQDALDKDKANIDRLGFFASVSVDMQPQADGTCLVVVEVHEYPTIKTIQVRGNTLVKAAEILSRLTLKPGEAFNTSAAVQSAKLVEDLYSGRGYFAKVDDFGPDLNSPGLYTFSVIEMHVGSVAVEGNKITKTSIVRRFIHTRDGEVFSSIKWRDDLERLRDLQLFKSVKSIDREPDPHFIDLTTAVVEKKTGAYNIGLDTGDYHTISGTAHLSESNWHGTAQSVSLDYTQSVVSNSGPGVSLSYTNPLYDAKDTIFRATAYSRVIERFSNTFGSNVPLPNASSYNERHTGGALNWERPLTDQLSVGFGTRYERVATQNVQTAVAGSFIQQNGDLGTLTGSVTLDRRDQHTDPSRGDYWRIDFEPGYSDITSAFGSPALTNDILGTSLFERTTLEYRRYWTKQAPRALDSEAGRRVLAFRARLGGIGGKVPFYEQYFAGGPETVRGYDEDSFWGKQMLLTTLEYRHPILSWVQFVPFVDYGGAWGGYGSVNNFQQSDSFRLHLGYGAGLNFNTFLGSIQTYLGFNERGKAKLQFLIGSSW